MGPQLHMPSTADQNIVFQTEHDCAIATIAHDIQFSCHVLDTLMFFQRTQEQRCFFYNKNVQLWHCFYLQTPFLNFFFAILYCFSLYSPYVEWVSISFLKYFLFSVQVNPKYCCKELAETCLLFSSSNISPLEKLCLCFYQSDLGQNSEWPCPWLGCDASFQIGRQDQGASKNIVPTYSQFPLQDTTMLSRSMRPRDQRMNSQMCLIYKAKILMCSAVKFVRLQLGPWRRQPGLHKSSTCSEGYSQRDVVLYH